MYLKHVREIGLDMHVRMEEGYKFRAVDTFQRNYNIDAIDLRSMLEVAIENTNLVVGAQYYPRKTLLEFAERYPVETRAALAVLYDKEKPVFDRMTKASALFDEINERRNIEQGKVLHTYMGLRFLSLLSSYRYPNEISALKPSEWKVYCRFIDESFHIPNLTSAGEQYRIYSDYIEPLRVYIKSREDIAEIKSKLTEGIGFKDEEYYWMAQDVIFVTARVLAGKRSEEVIVTEPSSEIPLLVNEEDPESFSGMDDSTGFMALESHLEEYVVRNWDLIDFGEKLDLHRDEDGSPGQQYTTDVGVIDILARDAGGNYVVIELKRAESGYKVVGQVLNYMGWVHDNLSQGGKKVRGLIVVGKADKTLRSALRPVSDKIRLLEYKVAVTLSEVK